MRLALSSSVGGQGLVVPIDTAELIEEIFVSATSQPPLSEVVEALAKKYGLNAPVFDGTATNATCTRVRASWGFT